MPLSWDLVSVPLLALFAGLQGEAGVRGMLGMPYEFGTRGRMLPFAGDA
jgi:hypothetical protein